MSVSFHSSYYEYAIRQHMATCPSFNSALFSGFPFQSSSPSLIFLNLSRVSSADGSRNIKNRVIFSRIGVASSHSNPNILKSKHMSRMILQEIKQNRGMQAKQVEHENFESRWGVRSLNSGKSLEMNKGRFGKRKGRNALYMRNTGSFHNTSKFLATTGSSAGDAKEKDVGISSKTKYHRLIEELDLDEGCFALLDYLSGFGLKDSHFIQMYERHMPSLQINVVSAQERLEFLLSVGVKCRDIRKMIMRQPQILEYTVENNLKSHVAFLAGLDIPDSKIGQIITATPSLFSYSVENSLKPTVRYLLEEVGIQKSDLSKVVQLSPQILVQRIDSSWNTRLKFLAKELGAPRDSIVKMVTKHPQLLHYSIEDGLLPRINFLRSIGLRNADILKVLTSLAQVLSLSLEKNLKPKYMYLINELRNEVHSLTKYPMYLSLSLDQRIRPRHRFLVSLKKAPKGPFPLSSFVPTDEHFCQQWAGTSLDKYLDFRQKLLLRDFAKKYER
ncbi:transcription termination factor MTERF9, chloroplastic isoform X2 [Coffea eugenioides]|uniref:transcription termination factor MTERF9, chloroplastic isoform X2 n=1 Tax=Coffea eugenioides TaxID=49369 RepID=UPI000F60D0A8|nr:transcription termination factor MTERF9, chloroplastic isoform X2 [Coffea eugenioides]